MEPDFNQEPQTKQNYFVFLWKQLTTSQKFGIGALLLLLIAFPLAIISVLLPTNPFSKAQFVPATPTGGATSFVYFSTADTVAAETYQVSVNQEFSLSAVLDSQLNTVSAVKAIIAFSPESLQVQNVDLTSYLPTVLEPVVIDNSAGIITFTVGSTAEEPKNGVGALASITFKATATSPGNHVTYNEGTEVAAVGEDGNVLQFQTPLVITINETPSITPTPTSAPNSADLQIKLKLDTVNVKANDLPLTVDLQQLSCEACASLTRDLTATNDDTGTYTANFTGVLLNPGDNIYKVFILPEGFLRKFMGSTTLVVGSNSLGDPQNPIVATPGDINGNGSVDIYDFTTVIEDYGLTNSPADFNRNGTVDIYDFTSVVENFGQTGD